MFSRNRNFKHYMQAHLPLYIFVSVLFLVGVVFGALMVNALSIDQRKEISQYLGDFFQQFNQGNAMDAHTSVKQFFALQFKWIVFIWILGISVVGLPLIFIFDFFKGVLVGFTVGYVAGQFSWKGILFILVSVVPQNLLVIPVVIISSVSAASFSIYLIKNRFVQRGGGKGPASPSLLQYSTITVSMVFLLFGASLVEAYVSPILMRWVTPMLM